MTERLLEVLRLRTNHRDLVFVREAVLLGELRTTSEILEAALRQLVADGLLEIISPLPFLVVKWRGRSAVAAKTAAGAVAFQSSLSQSKQLKESYRHQVVDEALLQEVLDALGETDPTTFRGALRRYPPGVIRMALARIRRMKNIQKNPTAVFRFLLPRIANEPAFKK